MAYLFLKELNSENDTVFAIDKDNFKEMPLAETYDRYGQLVGHESAGDYHPDNQYADFVEGDTPVLTMCEAYNYWNGHNWQSIITECGDMEDACSHSVVTDRLTRQRYNRAIREKRQVSDGFGLKVYRYADLIVLESFYQGAWEAFKIVHKDSYFNSLY